MSTATQNTTMSTTKVRASIVTQEKKKAIASELKKIVPSTWKYSLRVGANDPRMLVMTIKSAPIDLPKLNKLGTHHLSDSYCEIAIDKIAEQYEGEVANVMQQIVNALKADGDHKVKLEIGYWITHSGGPFQVI